MAGRCPMPEANADKDQAAGPGKTDFAPDIRPATVHDVADLADIHARAFPPEATWHAPAILRLLQTPGTFGLVSGSDAALTGFILMRAAAGEAEILTLAVDPDHERRGNARALVIGGLTTTLAVDCPEVYLEVAATNAPAIALYQSLGFVQTGLRKGYYTHLGTTPVDALVLRWAPDKDA